MNNRVDKNNYYLDIVAERSTCLRRNYGAVIVNNDEIVYTGYNGAPRGVPNCNDREQCERIRLGIPRGTNYSLCLSAHGEQNVIISASRKEMLGGTLYLSGKEHELILKIDLKMIISIKYFFDCVYSVIQKLYI